MGQNIVFQDNKLNALVNNVYCTLLIFCQEHLQNKSEQHLQLQIGRSHAISLLLYFWDFDTQTRHVPAIQCCQLISSDGDKEPLLMLSRT